MQKHGLKAALVLVAASMLLSGCSGTAGGSGSEASSSAAPSATEPPSTPLTEVTVADEAVGAKVTVLALVSDFKAAKPATDGLKAVLVKVRVEPGTEFRNSVQPSTLTITKRKQNLKYQTLGLTNPDVILDAMKTAGYTPFTGSGSGETTGWIGAWLQTKYKSFDLVYDRTKAKVLTGEDAGSTVPAYRKVVQLTPAG